MVHVTFPCSTNTIRRTQVCSVPRCNGISFHLCILLFLLYWLVRGKEQIGNREIAAVMTWNISRNQTGWQLRSCSHVECYHSATEALPLSKFLFHIITCSPGCVCACVVIRVQSTLLFKLAAAIDMFIVVSFKCYGLSNKDESWRICSDILYYIYMLYYNVLLLSVQYIKNKPSVFFSAVCVYSTLMVKYCTK